MAAFQCLLSQLFALAYGLCKTFVIPLLTVFADCEGRSNDPAR